MTDKITKYTIIMTFSFVLLLAVGIVLVILGRSNTYNTEDVLARQAKEISIEEVRNNNKASSCWTIVGGNVYEATNVISNNPNLKTILIKACGKDGTDYYTIKKFNEQELQESQINNLYNELEQYRIGILAP